MKEQRNEELKAELVSGYWIHYAHKKLFVIRFSLYMITFGIAASIIYFYDLSGQIDKGLLIAIVTIIIGHILISFLYALVMIYLRNSVLLKEIKMFNNGDELIG